MPLDVPRSGYTLPVFACAAAIAGLRYLHQPQPLPLVPVDLIEPADLVEIPIEQVAELKPGMVLVIARSDPGDNLDLTRDTPVWALVEWREEQRQGEAEPVTIQGGEGIGRHAEGGQAAIYAYAQKLLRENLKRWLKPGEKIQVTIILPEGRQLAQRTSNAAFGVVNGLSLLGTTGISQPLSAPGQLEASLEELRHKARELRERTRGEGGMERWGEQGEQGENNRCPMPDARCPIPHSPFPTLVFCVGENGLDLTRKMGIDPGLLVKTANWLGPLLVEAGIQQVPAILLFGYHGKLIKLAGGIFHTHHHLADARLEILTARCAQLGLPQSSLQRVFASATAEAALKYLRALDASTGSHWVEGVYGAIAQAIDDRAQAYIHTHSEQAVRVGSVLFDRDRQIIVTSQTGASLLSQVR